MPYKDSEKCKKYIVQYRLNNKEHIKKQNNKYRSNNKEKIMTWRENNKSYLKEYSLNKLYGLSLEEYQKLLSDTGGFCPICNVELRFDGNYKNSAVIDHNHLTGKVRGVTCRGCNCGLGQFKDNPLIVKKALDWLRK
jgi:hypothetical protein